MESAPSFTLYRICSIITLREHELFCISFFHLENQVANVTSEGIIIDHLDLISKSMGSTENLACRSKYVKQNSIFDIVMQTGF